MLRKVRDATEAVADIAIFVVREKALPWQLEMGLCMEMEKKEVLELAANMDEYMGEKMIGNGRGDGEARLRTNESVLSGNGSGHGGSNKENHIYGDGARYRNGFGHKYGTCYG